MDNSIKNQLTGSTAFYNQKGYVKTTTNELEKSGPLKPIYQYNTENKVFRIAKQILSVVIFPIGIYQLLHSLGGRILVPVSRENEIPRDSWSKPSFSQYRKESFEDIDPIWKMKRIAVKVDSCVIDAMIIGKESTLDNGRWVLASNGNGEFYERKLLDNSFQQILTQVNGNAIVFNYPGVGDSTGSPNRKTLTKAYKAMLCFLEDKEAGIGAHEIIGYGHSLGGGVQGEALKSHKLKEDINYVFVKSRTFSDLSTEASAMINGFAGLLVKILGWNMSSVESSKKLKAPEIIMQTAANDKIIDDDVIFAKASLAKKLENKKFCGKKLFMKIPEHHNDPLKDNTIQKLTTSINGFLK